MSPSSQKNNSFLLRARTPVSLPYSCCLPRYPTYYLFAGIAMYPACTPPLFTLHPLLSPVPNWASDLHHSGIILAKHTCVTPALFVISPDCPQGESVSAVWPLMHTSFLRYPLLLPHRYPTSCTPCSQPCTPATPSWALSSPQRWPAPWP